MCSPAKRVCLSPRTSSPISPDPPSIPQLLQLSEAEIWTLPKAELRKHFITLQNYARNPKDFSGYIPPAAPLRPQSRPLPPLLLLPPEIRDLIYSHLLFPPTNTPIRGPHPRQLQTQLSLSQAFHPQILRVNHQIYLEALRIFYGSATQTIHITIDYNVWTHKLNRSSLLLSPSMTASMHNLHISIHLGSEKKTSKPSPSDAEARLAVVKKGSRKLGKWLSGGDVRRLVVSWYEPPKTYMWDQKRDILDEFKVLRAESVELGVLNWGLNYSGKKYHFHEDYLKELQRDANGGHNGQEEA